MNATAGWAKRGAGARNAETYPCRLGGWIRVRRLSGSRNSLL